MKQKKPVIFLDIDGVLQPGHKQDRFKHDLKKLRQDFSEKSDPHYETMSEYDIGAVYYDWNDEAVKNLKTLIDEADAEIVLSSAWRERKSIKQLKLLFKIHDLDKYVIAKTPYRQEEVDNEEKESDNKSKLLPDNYIKADEFGSSRDGEIEVYLHKHTEIKQFVIIDDAYFNDLNRRFGKRFVYTSSHLKKKDLDLALQAIKIKDAQIDGVPQAVIDFDMLQNNDKNLTEINFGLNETGLICRYYQFKRLEFHEKFCKLIAASDFITKLTLKSHTNNIGSYYNSNSFKSEYLLFHKAIQDNKSIKHLDFSETSIKHSDSFFSCLLNKEQKLQSLIIKNCYFESDDLAMFIKEHKAPILIDISYKTNWFAPKYWKQNVRDALTNNPKVKLRAEFSQLERIYYYDIPENLEVIEDGKMKKLDLG